MEVQKTLIQSETSFLSGRSPTSLLQEIAVAADFLVYRHTEDFVHALRRFCSASRRLSSSYRAIKGAKFLEKQTCEVSSRLEPSLSVESTLRTWGASVQVLKAVFDELPGNGSITMSGHLKQLKNDLDVRSIAVNERFRINSIS